MPGTKWPHTRFMLSALWHSCAFLWWWWLSLVIGFSALATGYVDPLVWCLNRKERHAERLGVIVSTHFERFP